MHENIQTASVTLPGNAGHAADLTTERRTLAWVRWLLSLALLIGLLAFVDWRATISVLLNADARWWMFTALVAIGSRYWRAVKWNWLLREGGIHISHGHAFRICMESLCLGAITPGNLGSDAYRAFALNRFGKTSFVVMTLAWERYLGTLALASMAVVALPLAISFTPDIPPWAVVSVLLSLPVVMAILPLARWMLGAGSDRRADTASAPSIAAELGSSSPSLVRQLLVALDTSGGCRKILSRMQHEVRNSPISGRALVWFTIFTILEIVSYVLINLAMVRTLHMNRVPGWYLFSVLPPVFMLLRIPLTVQQLGTQELIYSYVFRPFGYSPADGTAFSVALRAVELMVVLLPGAILLWLFPARPVAQRSPSSLQP